MHLTVRNETAAFEVHVGPLAFASSKGFEFTNGDQLTVIGSKTTMDGKDVVLAREIKKGDAVLTLRDAKGFPLWARRNRG